MFKNISEIMPSVLQQIAERMIEQQKHTSPSEQEDEE